MGNLEGKKQKLNGATLRSIPEYFCRGRPNRSYIQRDFKGEKKKFQKVGHKPEKTRKARKQG